MHFHFHWYNLIKVRVRGGLWTSLLDRRQFARNRTGSSGGKIAHRQQVAFRNRRHRLLAAVVSGRGQIRITVRVHQPALRDRRGVARWHRSGQIQRTFGQHTEVARRLNVPLARWLGSEWCRETEVGDRHRYLGLHRNGNRALLEPLVRRCDQDGQDDQSWATAWSQISVKLFQNICEYDAYLPNNFITIFFEFLLISAMNSLIRRRLLYADAKFSTI